MIVRPTMEGVQQAAITMRVVATLDHEWVAVWRHVWNYEETTANYSAIRDGFRCRLCGLERDEPVWGDSCPEKKVAR